MFDGGALLRTPHQAEQYVRALEAYSDDGLLWRLTTRGGHGKQRLREAAGLGGVPIIVRLIRVLMQPRWTEPKYLSAVRACALVLWEMPLWIEQLTTAISSGLICEREDLVAIIDYGRNLFFATLDAADEAGGELVALAEALVRHSHNASEATIRCGAERLLRLVRGVHSGMPPGTGGIDEQLPGGRHSNDHPNFRKISVQPAMDEILAESPPFLPPSGSEVPFLADDPETQLLDRNFRLLREDFLASLRESLHGDRNASFLTVQAMRVDVRRAVDKTPDSSAASQPRSRICKGQAGVLLRVREHHALDQMVEAGYMRRGSLVLLLLHSDDPCTEPSPITFARVTSPPHTVDEIDSSEETVGDRYEMSVKPDNLLLLLLEPRWLRAVQVGRSFFSYEPVLTRLQTMVTLPFRAELLLMRGRTGEVLEPSAPEYEGAEHIIPTLQANLAAAGAAVDPAQHAAFEHAASHCIANIVGPPGTGKTFVAVELAHAILKSSSEKLLIVCYTNHALDQFLTEMVRKGWGRRGDASLVRVGGNSRDARMQRYSLHCRARQTPLDHRDRSQLHALYTERSVLALEMEEKAAQLQQMGDGPPSWDAVRELLQVEDPELLRRLSPLQDDEEGFLVTSRGKAISSKSDYLWRRWRDGRGPGAFELHGEYPWTLDTPARERLIADWRREIIRVLSSTLSRCARALSRNGRGAPSSCSAMSSSFASTCAPMQPSSGWRRSSMHSTRASRRYTPAAVSGFYALLGSLAPRRRAQPCTATCFAAPALVF